MGRAKAPAKSRNDLVIPSATPKASAPPEKRASSRPPATPPSRPSRAPAIAIAKSLEVPPKPSARLSRASSDNARISGGGAKAPPKAKSGAAGVIPAVGSEVMISVYRQNLKGIVAFAGTTTFSVGDWLGVILDEPKGKNDGTVQGVKYFECQSPHGVFIRPASVVEIITEGTGTLSNDNSNNNVATPEDHWKQLVMRSLQADKKKNLQESFQAYVAAVKEGVALDLRQYQDSGYSRSSSSRQPVTQVQVSEGERQAAREALVEACEEHDDCGIRRCLPIAERAGVPDVELDSARRLAAHIEELNNPFLLDEALEEMQHMLQNHSKRLLEEIERVGKEQMAELRGLVT